MLNFRTSTIALLLFAASVLILLFFNIRLGMWPILAIVVWLILLITGSVNICSDFYIKAFCKGKTSEKLITLTFDDGPDAKNTPKILDILEKHNLPATFFLIGNKAENQVDLVRLIISKGNLVGLHSYSHHFFFDFYRKGKMEQDLVRAEEVIDQIARKQGGREAWRRGIFFRPPYGVTNPVLARVAKKLGYRVVGWSVRSLDTTIRDAEKIAERVIRKLHPGAVILMHDTQDVTPAALEKIILNAKDEGYRFVGLEELLSVEAYE